MTRLARSDVERQLRHLNSALGRPEEAHTYADGQYIHCNVGHLTLSGAYGGWQVQEIVSAGGGIRNLTQGYAPLREVSTFLDGMSAALSLLLPRDAYGRVATWDVEYRAIPKEPVA
jgi:hypothetical protein